MKAKFKNYIGFGDTKPNVGGRRETVKVSDLVEMLDWPKKGKPVTVRLVGPVVGRGIHKIKVRKKDGTEVEIQKACLAYNPKTDEKDSTVKCPYCKLPTDLAKFSKLYFVNAIVRELQEDKPGKLKRPTKTELDTGFKEIDSDTWTPVRVVRVPSSLALRIKQLGEKNIVKSKTGEKKHFDPMHEKFGFDIDITFDKSLPAANMYSADRAESPSGEKYSALSEEESNYLLWDIDQLYPAEDFEEAKKEAKSLQDRWVGGDNEDEDDDEPKSRKKPLLKAKHVDDDEDDDIDLDDEEDNAPKSKKSKKPADDEDDELDLDEDDDTPPKKSAKKPVKASKASDDDDDDADEEDDDDYTPPKKSSKKPVDDEDDDELDDLDEDDEDEEDDDEEEVPPKKSSKKPVKKSKKPADDEDVEDDDDDDLDEDDEDDDEEEAPPKKAPAKKRGVR